MRKMGVKLVVLGAVVGGALLTGCSDDGRSWAMRPQEDYFVNPNSPDATPLQRGVNTGFPLHLSELRDEGTATGGSGEGAGSTLPVQGNSEAGNLWLKQDFRVPYAPPQFQALVAPALGTGKPLRVGANGAWVQGLYAVELGSGMANAVSPSSATYQPQEVPTGDVSVQSSKGSPVQERPQRDSLR